MLVTTWPMAEKVYARVHVQRQSFPEIRRHNSPALGCVNDPSPTCVLLALFRGLPCGATATRQASRRLPDVVDVDDSCSRGSPLVPRGAAAARQASRRISDAVEVDDLCSRGFPLAPCGATAARQASRGLSDVVEVDGFFDVQLAPSKPTKIGPAW